MKNTADAVLVEDAAWKLFEKDEELGPKLKAVYQSDELPRDLVVAAFNTVRFSEKSLERAGISVETLDLYEVYGRAERMKDSDPALKAKFDAMTASSRRMGSLQRRLVRMAKFGAVVESWMQHMSCKRELFNAGLL